MNNQRTKLTIKLLEQSLIKLLSNKNIYEISIRELCDEAGINRSTFYRYFGSQFDLLSLMEDELVNNIQSYFAEDISSLDETQIRKQMIMMLEYLKENYDFTKLLLNNNVDPEFPTRLFELPCIKALIERAVESQELGELNDYYKSFMITGGFAVLRQWVNNGCTIKPKIIADALAKFSAIK